MSSGSLSSFPAFAGLSGRQVRPPACPRTAAKEARRHHARSRLLRSDRRIGAASLLGAALAMPLVASPEAASVLAVASIALLAGQRWAVGLVIAAELVLLAALIPFALAQTSPLLATTAWASAAAAVPSLAATRRGAAALVLLSGVRRTRATCRAIHVGLIALAILAGCAPML